MKNGCESCKCCICLYGNECSIIWKDLPYNYCPSPSNQIIQRLNDYQFYEYRDRMILSLKELYNIEYSDPSPFTTLARRHDFISQDEQLDVCPFCGGPAEMYITKHIPRGYDFTPRCKQTACCGRLTKKYPSRSTALHYWNMRIPLDRVKAEVRDKGYLIKDLINSSKKLSQYGIQMIDTDGIFFSSYDSAIKYAKQDPAIPFSSYSIIGQIIHVREDNGYIGKYFIASDRSLQKYDINNDESKNKCGSEIYTKQKIDEMITEGYL